jgi:hypothetical protein
MSKQTDADYWRECARDWERHLAWAREHAQFCETQAKLCLRRAAEADKREAHKK